MWVSGQGHTHECEWVYLVDLHYFAVVIIVRVSVAVVISVSGSVCGVVSVVSVSGGVVVVVVYELVDGLVDGI